jgi:hypothetical protein
MIFFAYLDLIKEVKMKTMIMTTGFQMQGQQPGQGPLFLFEDLGLS